MPPNMTSWASFHNGVAAGLKIAPASQIDSAWIVYNKPKHAELANEYAGFLMALGLNGHLTKLATLNIHDYLTKVRTCHPYAWYGATHTYCTTSYLSACTDTLLHLQLCSSHSRKQSLPKVLMVCDPCSEPLTHPPLLSALGPCGPAPFCTHAIALPLSVPFLPLFWLMC